MSHERDRITSLNHSRSDSAPVGRDGCRALRRADSCGAHGGGFRVRRSRTNPAAWPRQHARLRRHGISACARAARAKRARQAPAPSLARPPEVPMTSAPAQTAGTASCATLAASPRSTRRGPRTRPPPAPMAAAGSWAPTAMPGGDVHGFLRSKRGFRQIDFPGAKGTVVWRTNARADRWSGPTPHERDTAAQFFEHGFVLDKRGFRKIDIPGASQTRPFGINNRGQIVGQYLDRDGHASRLPARQRMATSPPSMSLGPR